MSREIMQARKFNITEDFSQMLSWYQERGSDCPSAELIPPTGAIVDGCAAGFLYVTEENQIGLLEGYITNQLANHEDRKRALDLVTAYLIEEAKQKKILRLMSFTSVQTIFDLAIKNEFNYVGSYHCLAKVL
jgi:hypothetical protein